MRVGLLSPTDYTDPTLYWICRDLEANPAVDVEASVIVPEGSEEHFERVSGVARSYLSDGGDYDLLLVLGAKTHYEEVARIVRNLDCRAIVACDSYDEDAVGYRIKSGLSYLADMKIADFAASVGEPDLFAMAKLKFYGGFALDGSAAARRKRPGAADRGRTVVFSVADDDIKAIAPLLDSSFAAKEITILTKGSLKSFLMSERTLCKTYAISEAPLDFILGGADRLVDLSGGLSGDMHRYLLYSALSQDIDIYCKRDLAELVSIPPGFVGPRDTREFFLAAMNSIQGGSERLVLRDERSRSVTESYRARLTDFLVSHAPKRRGSRPAKKQAASKICFVAINGNGLGHAQRVVSLAREIGAAKKGKRADAIEVATFPTCIDFVQANGFNVVPLLTRHGQTNDPSIELVNFKRLSGALNDASAFVFDGGYPYDSVIGACQMFRGPKLWIRRGLWRDDQDNRQALDREKYFDRIVRPLEMFDELNGTLNLWRGDASEVAVGPVVCHAYDKQVQEWAAGMRRGGKRLVVSMLGGGFTSDRSNMLYSIARKLEAYEDVVHLAVSWPQAVYPAGIDRFANTRLIATNFGSSILSKADLYIGAAGYNTFHECMYHRLPSLFVPQSASWLDDQEARAAAAQDRGLAISAGNENLLEILRGIDFMLAEDGIEQCANAFKNVDLPEPGNAAAAKIIMEPL